MRGHSKQYQILRNPFYYGLVERTNDGEKMTIWGIHKPIITDEIKERLYGVLLLSR